MKRPEQQTDDLAEITWFTLKTVLIGAAVLYSVLWIRHEATVMDLQVKVWEAELEHEYLMAQLWHQDKDLQAKLAEPDNRTFIQKINAIYSQITQK